MAITSWVKDHWKIIVAVLAPLVIITIIFALPIKTVPVQATEKYWDTELRSEPYTTTETYSADEPYITTETQTATVYDSWIYAGNWSYTFQAAKPNSTVEINVYGYSYYPRYYIINSPSDNSTPHIQFWPGDYYYGDQSRAVIKVSYPEQVTKYRTVTKTREVTKYHDVSTPVQKERTVTQYVTMSIWSYLFR